MINKLVKLVPPRLKPCLKLLYQDLILPLRVRITKQASLEEVHKYWKAPPDAGNRPEDYLAGGEARSQFLVDIVRKHLAADGSILELGCNAGRNLSYLYSAGFRNLHGLEINLGALELLRSRYSEMAGQTVLWRGSAEEILPTIPRDTFDVVFTMAVLEHIQWESEFIFSHITRISRAVVITIEDETNVSERHFPRNYGRMFEKLGVRQIWQCDCRELFGGGFVARVFRKAGQSGLFGGARQ